MARMHSRARGKSGSKRPVNKIPSWALYKEKDVEKLVIKFSKAGKTASEIGMILRDSYGINSVKALTEKKISEILVEHNVVRKLPEDLLALIKRMIEVKQHLEKNHKDQSARRGMLLTNSKIKRVVKYYQRTKKIPAEWKLDMDKLKMYLE